MAELEQALVALGRELDFPPTPDVAGSVRDAVIATVIRSGSATVLLTELQGEQTWLSKKVVDPQTTIEGVQVGSHDGLFLSGGRHVLMYEVSPGEVGQLYTRFAGNVL